LILLTMAALLSSANIAITLIVFDYL